MAVTTSNIITTGMALDTTESTIAITDTGHDMDGTFMLIQVTGMPFIIATMAHRTFDMATVVLAW
jgi:hypothetical protein